MSAEHPIRPIKRAGVPLAAFETSDPALTIAGVMRALNGKARDWPIMQWDICRGLIGANGPGQAAAEAMADEPTQTINPIDCLTLLREKAPADSLIFFHNAQNVLTDPTARQAIWNLRDAFKANNRTLVMLGPVITLPAELKHDCVVVSEPLPDMAGIKSIITSVAADAGMTLEDAQISKAADALLGLSAFAAEQCLAMSISKSGLDLAGLWERKRQMIEQTPGLSVWRGGESFAEIGGCDNVKDFMQSIIAGKKAPRAICFIDEIEKALAGAAGDLSGVSQDTLGALLTFMQDKQSTGVIFIGPPGAAKSAIAKATGNTAGIPTIAVDLGAMKGSLVGQSEQQLRQALNVIDAVSQGQTLFVATCNSFGNLPPELKRRFTLGTFFFDLPSKEERIQIWKIYQDKYDLGFDLAGLPADEGWTGAEIRQCCDIAWRLGRSLTDAAKFIVPVSRSAADQIETLRKQASGKFVSASGPGIYTYARPIDQPTGRKFQED